MDELMSWPPSAWPELKPDYRLDTEKGLASDQSVGVLMSKPRGDGVGRRRKAAELT